MGLVMLGSKSAEAIEDMVGYAQETQHEKIQRGLAIGIALVMYGRLEEADTLIDTLCRDKDANLRRSGMYTIAMAYCGTASNAAIQRLLHMAASDVDPDVRRTAVMALGFLLFKKPEQVSFSSNEALEGPLFFLKRGSKKCSKSEILKIWFLVTPFSGSLLCF